MKKTLVAVLAFAFVSSAAAQPIPPQAKERAAELVGQMTLDEKIDYIGGYNEFYIRAVPRLGIPRNPDGRRSAGRTQQYPQYDVPLRRGRRGDLGPGAGARYGTRSGAGRPRPRRAYHAGTRRQYLPFAPVRPQLRVLRRGPLSGVGDHRAVYRGHAVRRGYGDDQTLCGQQSGVGPSSGKLRYRRAHAPRNLSPGLPQGRSSRPAWAP